jgi:hypothetical protein
MISRTYCRVAGSFLGKFSIFQVTTSKLSSLPKERSSKLWEYPINGISKTKNKYLLSILQI